MGTNAVQILVTMGATVKMELVPTLARAWMVIKARTVNLVSFCFGELWRGTSQGALQGSMFCMETLPGADFCGIQVPP